MTRDEIVQIAWDVGILMRSHHFQDEPTKLEQFAERIAAAEREACAMIAEETTISWTEYDYNSGCMDCAKAIRARGEA